MRKLLILIFLVFTLPVFGTDVAFRIIPLNKTIITHYYGETIYAKFKVTNNGPTQKNGLFVLRDSLDYRFYDKNVTIMKDNCAGNLLATGATCTFEFKIPTYGEPEQSLICPVMCNEDKSVCSIIPDCTPPEGNGALLNVWWSN